MANYDIDKIYGILGKCSDDVNYLGSSIEKFSDISTFITKKIKEIRSEIVKLETKKTKVAGKTRTVTREYTASEGTPGKRIVEGGAYKENKSLYQEAANILWENMQEAVKINEEYDHPFFLSRLKKVAYNPHTISITNDNYHVIVQIFMDNVAGSLSDYAKGVVKAREKFAVKEFREGDDKGSSNWFWQEKYYGIAREGRALPNTNKKSKKDLAKKASWLRRRYWETLQSRMDASGKIAPFWQLLDQGTLPMKSDRGGEAYPPATPTNFVDHSKNQILRLILGTSRYVTRSYQEEINEEDFIQTNIENIKVTIAEYESALEIMENLLDRGGVMQIDTEIYGDIAKRLENNIERTDKSKLETLLIALRSGNIGNVSVTKEGRVELTKPGGKRYRISIRKAMLAMGLEY